MGSAWSDSRLTFASNTMHYRRLFSLMSIAAVLGLISLRAVGAEVQSGQESPAVRCAHLALSEAGDVSILSAVLVPGSDHETLEFPGRSVPVAMLLGGKKVSVPDYCRIKGYVRPAINFEVRLPVRDWNGKFYMVGCAGLCGRLDSPEQSLGLIVGLSRSYVVATTDAGHWGSSNQDGRWAYANPIGRDDYAARGIHETARVAKLLIHAFYDSVANHSYFEGCSNGGRQGLMEAARYPEDFDGVVAGTPGVDFQGIAALYARIVQADRDSRGGHIFNVAKLALVTAAVGKACGDKTGLIDHPESCRFDPASLQCKSSPDNASCLTAAEVGVLRKWYSPPTLKSGKRAYPAGLPYGSEPFWAAYGDLLGGQKLLGSNLLQYVLPPLGSTYDIATFNLENDLAKIEPQTNALRPSADLTAFKARGGKVLIYHGLADPWIPPAESTAYFEAVEKALGGREVTRDTARLFLIPGWDHCGIAAAVEKPGPDLGLFGYAGLGALPALEQWVEHGAAPERLNVAKYDGRGALLWSRPVCPYPRQAEYSGSGERKDARNWECTVEQRTREPGIAKPPPTGAELPPDARADALVKAMTIDEKIQMLHGQFGWLRGSGDAQNGSLGGEGYLAGIPRLGIPDLQLIDGALGVTNLGRRPKGEATAMPSSLSLAASFDTDLAYQSSAVVGREARAQGFNVLLAGGVNIEREARNGRNFEYLGEDPLLAGRMVAAQLRGIQDQGVIATIKHYAVNTQETDRYGINARIDERSLREIDLLPFEIGVKESNVGSVMCAYNRVNGIYSCENDYLLNKVLKTEWGFKGWVMSDWGATHSTVSAANAGLDQEFPASKFFSDPLKQAVERGQVSTHRVDDMVHRILRTMITVGLMDERPAPAVDKEQDLAVALKAAERGIVLLRNTDSLLPLSADKPQSIAVIGKHADAAVISGGGSAQVDPFGGKIVDLPADQQNRIEVLFAPTWDLSSPLASIRAKAPAAIVTFDSGDDPAAAASLAAKSDIVIVLAHDYRREGRDASALSLPDGQNELIERIAAANRRTVVVLETGGPCLTPWAEKVAAIVESWYPGNRGGEAIAGVLFGEVNPSAKLPITFPASESDLPRPSIVGFPDTDEMGVAMGSVQPRMLDVDLSEGLNVGYKWFDSRGKTPRYPFGFGLSYTTFAYSNLRVEKGKTVRADFHVKNTGKRSGTEIAQVYVGLPPKAGEPPRRLAAWALVPLEPGEDKTVAVEIDPAALSIWDVKLGRWRVPAGVYQVYAGPSSRDLPLHLQTPIGENE
jgi:beta-glucosidase